MGSWTKYGEKTAPPWSWSFDTIITGGDGIYEFYTRAYDKPNNYEDSPITKDTQTIVDTIKPIISVISPQNGSTITSSTVDIFWVGSDITSEIDHFEIKIDNSTYVDVGVETNYTFFDVGDGDHIIVIKAVDKAGNSEEIVIEINIDTKPSSLDILITLYIVIGLIAVIIILILFLSIRKKKSSQPPPP
jgi:hypothetical protein